MIYMTERKIDSKKDIIHKYVYKERQIEIQLAIYHLLVNVYWLGTKNPKNLGKIS